MRRTQAEQTKDGAYESISYHTFEGVDYDRYMSWKAGSGSIGVGVRELTSYRTDTDAPNLACAIPTSAHPLSAFGPVAQTLAPVALILASAVLIIGWKVSPNPELLSSVLPTTDIHHKVRILAHGLLGFPAGVVGWGAQGQRYCRL